MTLLYNSAASSFHTEKLCSRLYSIEIELFRKTGKFAFQPTFEGLGGNHIRSIPAKSSSTRNLSKCPQKLREPAYISLIWSRLEYCAAVWDAYLIKDINILEGIQRIAARFVIQDHSRFTSVSSLVKDLNWAPLKDRRRDIRLAMLFKIVKCNIPVQVDTILLPVDPRTRHHHISKFRHILSHSATNIRFLLEQYLSGTLFLQPASTRTPSPHSRHSSVTRTERCAHSPSSWYAKVVWRL